MYEVGQVLYTINNERKSIIPIRVIEQVIKKSIDGETIEYTVEVPGKAGNKKTNISMFKNLFLSLEEVQSFLLNNAKKEVNRLIERAEAINEKYFNLIKKEKQNTGEILETVENNVACKNNNESVIIDLGNGQKGNISINNIKDSLGQKKT